MKNKIIYSLSIEDLQNVANQEIERELTRQEIEKLEKSIAEKIPWYDVIAGAIEETIVNKKEMVN